VKISRKAKFSIRAAAFLALVVASIVFLEIRPMYFIEGIPDFIRLVGDMLPPNIKVLLSEKTLWSIIQTIAMSITATVIGAGLSFIIALPAAANISSPLVSSICKSVIAATRVVPELIVVLILTVVVGLGPFTVVLALVFGCIGMLGKLFAETIEIVDPRPLEALQSVGVTKLQLIRFGILPQVLPSFIANTLYRNDINLRAALFLGMLAGGGIGYQLQLSLRIFKYQDALAITLLVLIVIAGMEAISNALRKRIIGKEVLQ
jgi:phosphonate transport system permease protein